MISVLYSQINSATVIFPDRLTLLSQLQKREFTQLSTLLSDYQQAYEQGEGDERLIAYFLETFANSDPVVEDLIGEWLVSSPDSYIPYLVRGYYYYGVAWSWRGYRGEENTSNDRQQRMRHYLQVAANDLTRAVEINPRLSAAYAAAIRILTIIGSPELKKQAFEEALVDDPDSYLLRSAYLWGLSSRWGGDTGEVEAFIMDNKEHAGTNELLTLMTGYHDYVVAESLQKEGRFTDAQIYFDTAISQGADQLVFRKRGINYYQLKNYEMALSDFNTALQLWPQDSKVLRWRAYTLWQLDEKEAALTDLELASQLNPYNKYILMARASFRRKLGLFDTVADNYINALFYNEHDADIWYAKGMHYYRDLLDFKTALTDLRRAAELQPKKAKYWYEYAAILHYNLDCEITAPLQHYLELCAEGASCNEGEYSWASRAWDWLQESKRCVVAEEISG